MTYTIVFPPCSELFSELEFVQAWGSDLHEGWGGVAEKKDKSEARHENTLQIRERLLMKGSEQTVLHVGVKTGLKSYLSRKLSYFGKIFQMAY